ncbi:hypothetical protein GGTG_04713 [Gaeumannomyces tritici R3-111a-1]|uniref:Uncharacterized protein n=1 Tax=Gaeumannomyces tritici (strain R3-111a-1) TaxID=644352 RepID=J3NTW4_GAET3|nr:hypothetical protein GGTG_04713 [Gaeumannomyces tritici R3-111a-1]EJT79629.1 hypothetical protein GGTG_04713 [Gaeumannomyces tritici R3-111a-1]
MFDDRMSDNDDDGSASLVGFGEGAGSTVSGPIYRAGSTISGPIYQRRPVPGTSSAGAMAFARWQLERGASGLGDPNQLGVGDSGQPASSSPTGSGKDGDWDLIRATVGWNARLQLK